MFAMYDHNTEPPTIVQVTIKAPRVRFRVQGPWKKVLGTAVTWILGFLVPVFALYGLQPYDLIGIEGISLRVQRNLPRFFNKRPRKLTSEAQQSQAPPAAHVRLAKTVQCYLKPLAYTPTTPKP